MGVAGFGHAVILAHCRRFSWLLRLESPSRSGWELLVLVMQSASLQKIQLVIEEGDNDQIKCKVCNEPLFIIILSAYQVCAYTPFSVYADINGEWCKVASSVHKELP